MAVIVFLAGIGVAQTSVTTYLLPNARADTCSFACAYSSGSLFSAALAGTTTLNIATVQTLPAELLGLHLALNWRQHQEHDDRWE